MKACTKCLKTLPLSDFYLKKVGGTEYRYECKSCLSARCREYQLKNKEKIRAKAKQSRLIDTDKYNETRRIQKCGYRAQLSDVYIKQTLIKRTALKASQIPSELIELKRLEILITRKAKEIEDEKC